jgi:hypothetical protein
MFVSGCGTTTALTYFFLALAIPSHCLSQQIRVQRYWEAEGRFRESSFVGRGRLGGWAFEGLFKTGLGELWNALKVWGK